ncbi:14467_t:CDS:2 [Entrophospora sp. SA101]|nr:14467_t:CDS:2 [Entrophospora sp. SA101]
MCSNIKLLVERLNLSEEQKKLLENPPDIVKMTIDDLVSFSNKPKKNPQRIQNVWIIFLKNFGEYLRKKYPDETFSMIKISRSAAGVWNNLEDTNSTKIYFRILAKIAKENWKVIDNNEIVVATSPSPFLLESFSSTSSEADLFVPIENEPLINNGNDISTNELVAIIPQANLIDTSFIAPDVDIAGPLDDDIHNSNSGDNDDVVTISGEIILQFSLPERLFPSDIVKINQRINRQNNCYWISDY